MEKKNDAQAFRTPILGVSNGNVSLPRGTAMESANTPRPGPVHSAFHLVGNGVDLAFC